MRPDFDQNRPVAIDAGPLLGAILPGMALRVRGAHGVVHWARVLENGLAIAARTGADEEIVTLFALFHDSRRVNEALDPGHGLRGAELARSFRGTLLHLDDARFALLHEACALHTDGESGGYDPTVLTCWDADRLDLGRVGIRPDPLRLCTDAGRALLRRADARARGDHEPPFVREVWKV